METVSQSGLLLWDRTALKSVRSGPVPVPQSGPASLTMNGIRCSDQSVTKNEMLQTVTGRTQRLEGRSIVV